MEWKDYPHLLAELDMSKNKNHTYKGKPCSVLDLSSGTANKLDWKCSTCEHEWIATGDGRVRGDGCPACFGYLHSDGRNSMAITHPKLANEYQGDANLIIAGTHKKLDWKCSTCEHEWKTAGSMRVRGNGCPSCAGQRLHSDGRNSMFNIHPKLAKEYQGDANLIMAGTHKKLNWKCITCEHEWRAVGSSRVRGNGCPSCANQVINNFDARNNMTNTHPKLAKEYQGDANLIIAGTPKKLDWKCITCEHEWKTAGSMRVNGNGCPACSGRVVHSDGRNSMTNTHPQLAEEYQGDANLIMAGTNKKLEWKCITCEHEWKAQGNSRVIGRGCPACFGHLHSDRRNSMYNTHPKLAKEYQGDANLIIAGTNIYLDWKCSTCEHEWNTQGYNRAGGKGCPVCAGQRLHCDGRNSMFNTHPKLAEEYQGDANLIMAGTSKKLNWNCITCEHMWSAVGSSRVNGTGCPECAVCGFKSSQPGYCYLLKYQFSDGDIKYKQGITNDVKRRVSQLSCDVNKVFPETKVILLGKIYFEVGQHALDLENHFKRIKEIRWTPDQSFDGSTEMYSEGILDAWKESINRC
jgi:DNA-directed RNA polymerase subunit RPC12/RpoP